MSKTTRDWYRNEYLNSAWWQEMRKRVYKKYGYKCSIVGCTIKKLNIHHLGYKNVGKDKELNDLRPVCWIHHLFCHYRLFKRQKVPMNQKCLSDRYYEIRRFNWRFIRPSDIMNI